MKINPQNYITFDDVLLEPQYSEIDTRSNVDISTLLSSRVRLNSPIIAANMDSISSVEMAASLRKHGGLCPIHRFMSIEDQVESIKRLMNAGLQPIAATIGVNGDWKERLQALMALYEPVQAVKTPDRGKAPIKRVRAVSAVFIDIAHGHSKTMLNVISQCVEMFPDIDFIPGNVATAEAVLDFQARGAAAVKVGVGPGSACSTRGQTGFGVPQLSAIINCCKVANVPIIADGGISKPGDIVKALAAGASTVMVGNLIAGTKEAAGNIINVDGVKFKVYRGQACYSSDTEILTQNGWRNRNSLSYEDKVATLNPVSNVLEYQNPLNIFKYDYSGNMLRIDSKYVDLCVTPNHRMYVAKRSRVSDGYARKFRFVLAEDLYGSDYIFKRNCKWVGRKEKYFSLPGSSYRMPMDLWLRFFGFWLAEGCSYTYIQKKKYKTPVVEISNKNECLIKEMVGILKQGGIHSKYRYRKNKDIYELRCYNKYLYNYLSQFGKAPNKFIPNEIKNLSMEYLKPLLHYIFLGDGCSSRNCIYTTSKLLRDDIAEIALKCGMAPSFYILKRADTFSSNPSPRTGRKLHRNYDLYAINIGESFSEVIIKKERHSIQKYSGIVWCVEVPNGVVYTRRNNKTVWCGNSKDAQLDWKGGDAKFIYEEGVSTLVPYKGKVEDIIINAHNGIKSGLSYCGASNIIELQKKAVFQLVSPNTLYENATRLRFGK